MNKTCLDPYAKGPRAAEPEDISEEESSADSTNGTHSGAGNRILNQGSGAIVHFNTTLEKNDKFSNQICFSTFFGI